MKAVACFVLPFIALSAARADDALAPPSAPVSAPVSAPSNAPASAASASAAPASELQPEYHYVVGLQYQFTPESPGAANQRTSFSPVWALRWERLHLSNGGGSALMGFGTRVFGPGASAELLGGSSWHLGASLLMDSGRESGNADNTRGLPDVRRTVRGRLFASDALTPDIQISASLSEDLLGRGGGLIVNAGAEWRLAHDRMSEWTLGAGVSGGNVTYMQSYYGVGPSGSVATGLRVYAPEAGLEKVYAGTAYTRAIDRHWIAYASFGASRLIGPAADSPLDARPQSAGWSLRLAYRR